MRIPVSAGSSGVMIVPIPRMARIAQMALRCRAAKQRVLGVTSLLRKPAEELLLAHRKQGQDGRAHVLGELSLCNERKHTRSDSEGSGEGQVTECGRAKCQEKRRRQKVAAPQSKLDQESCGSVQNQIAGI